MKRVLLLLLSFVAIAAFGGSSTAIQLRAPQMANDSVFLAGYFNGKIYANDTVLLDAKGKGTFREKEGLPQGMYMLYFGPSRMYEFLLGADQEFELVLDTLQKGVKISALGSIETEAFVAFAKFMVGQRDKQELLQKELELAKKDEAKKKEVEAKILQLDTDVVDYEKNMAKIHAGNVMGVFVSSLITPSFPAELQDGDMKDTDFQMKRYQYAKNHYWDNINVADPRSWRLNMINQKLDVYMKNVLIQIPDSIIPPVVDLVEKSRQNDTTFNLMTNYMMSYSVSCKIMGMDKLMVELANKYYFTGLAKAWADSALMETIKGEVAKVKYNLIGMQAQNLKLQTYQGQTYHFYDSKAKYTVVAFYEPSCGHCKEVIPKLYTDIYKKYKDKGLEVIAVYIMTDKTEWFEFMQKHKLNDWVNAWDPTRESYYWHYYDTSTTPGLYLLDKDKKIVAKKFDIPSLDKILDFELNGVTPKE